VVVVGLGPAGPDLIHHAALEAVAAHPPAARFVRTERHPAVAGLGEHHSFDEVYERADSLDDVYREIVRRLAAAAAEHGSVCYLVPGSPLVAEHTVELLRARPDLDVRIHPALSFLDLAWARLGVDPVAAGVRLVDGQRFATEAAGQTGPLLVAQCDHGDVLSAIKLAVEDGPAQPVTVLQRLGLPDEVVCDVAWDELDRAVRADHLTSLWIPELNAPVAGELVRFAELVRTLRERCPWDSVQTHESLRPFVIEEAYEVVDAIDHADVDGLEEELGDLLFQVVIHATLAAEQGSFTLADVARHVHDKLHRRHPHVFGETTVDGAADVVRNWDQIKAEEKGRTGPYDGIPASLPPRLFAEKLQRRAERAGLHVDLAAELEALDRAEADLSAVLERIIGGAGGGR
jgi:tetrapyrrole methylase family protein/MazG family protein